jgi:hypothetical protein
MQLSVGDVVVYMGVDAIFVGAADVAAVHGGVAGRGLVLRPSPRRRRLQPEDRGPRRRRADQEKAPSTVPHGAVDVTSAALLTKVKTEGTEQRPPRPSQRRLRCRGCAPEHSSSPSSLRS